MDYRYHTSRSHRRMRLRYLSGLALGLTIAASAHAHNGVIDSYGCHPNVSHGSYHCHEGYLAGRAYKNRAKMIEAYREREQDERVRTRNANPPQAETPAPRTEY